MKKTIVILIAISVFPYPAAAAAPTPTPGAISPIDLTPTLSGGGSFINLLLPVLAFGFGIGLFVVIMQVLTNIFDSLEDYR